MNLKMPDLVMNTGPVIALTAAVGSLDFLKNLYTEIILPFEVVNELGVEGNDCPEILAVQNCPVIKLAKTPVKLPILLSTQLDTGEASVIQTAQLENIETVVIDEKLGRRIARLHDLKVTGSIGILVKAVRLKIIPDLNECFDRMEQKGIWISQLLKKQALESVRL